MAELGLRQQLLFEVAKYVTLYTEQALESAFGNLHIEPAHFESFKDELSERLGALARHDTEIFLSKLERL
jgi:hypothetical protein